MASSLSPAQLAMGLIGGYAVIKHTLNLMKAFQIPTKAEARSIAFFLILINSYDVMGALQNNWAVYRFAAVSRIFAAALFWILGPPWSKVVKVELVTLAILAVGMFLG